MTNKTGVAEELSVAMQLHQSGQLEAAMERYSDILLRVPHHTDTWYLRGMAAIQMNRLEEAEKSLLTAHYLLPTHPEILAQLGHLVRQRGDMRQALEWYEKVVELNPEDGAAHNNVGATLQALGEIDAALEAYEQAVSLSPRDPTFHNNLGLIYAMVDRLPDAVRAHAQAIMLRSDYADAYFNLGNIYQRQSRFEEAIKAYLRVIELSPENSDVYYNLGTVLNRLKRSDEALAVFEKRYALRPDSGISAAALQFQLQSICDWSRLDELSQRVIEAVESSRENELREPIAPFTFLGLAVPTSAAQQLRCNERWGRKVVASIAGRSLNLKRNRLPYPHRRLRIGYLSEDFHVHPVAYAVAELFEAHHRDRFEIYGYSYGPDDQSSIRQRLEAGFDHFRDLESGTIEQAAQEILDDEIDILVDLQGYTGESRTAILACRPAPIQVNFLGFAGSLGGDWVDYIIVDRYVVPADQQPFFRERLVHLPGCYLPSDSRLEIATRTPTRSEHGLPEGPIVFASFNNSYKITPQMFDCWMRILHRVSKSILWLRDWGETTKQNLRREATARGIDPDRLHFAPQVPMPEHTARHRLVDLFLDTFPYNAHATASIALRMGVPLVTLSGQTFPTRVAGSMLASLGLSSLIARDLGQYENICVRLAESSKERQAIRQQLEAQVSSDPFFSGAAFADKLERAYEEMWRIYRDHQPPQPIVIH